MRIGIDIRALMEGKTTGVQVYITNLLRHLFQLDRENQYLLFANSFQDVTGRIKRFSAPNVCYRIFRFPNKLFNLSEKVLRRPRADLMLGGLDLFFSPHWRAVSLSASVPLVVTFHDLSYEVYPEFFTLRQRLWHKFMGYRDAARRADTVVAVSQSTRDDLINFYQVSAEKIRVIYPGVAPAPSNLSAAESGALLPAGFPKSYFLYFGTFEPRKNLSAVLGAYEEYCAKSRVKLPLVLAGSSGWKSKPVIPRHLADLVFIKNNVSDALKAALYANAFALLFLSFYEGFGFPVLEAASLGVPVLASFGSSLTEIAGDFAILVNPFRPAHVAAAMLDLESDRNFYLHLQESSRKAAGAFRWDNAAREMLQLFREIKK